MLPGQQVASVQAEAGGARGRACRCRGGCGGARSATRGGAMSRPKARSGGSRMPCGSGRGGVPPASGHRMQCTPPWPAESPSGPTSIWAEQNCGSFASGAASAPAATAPKTRCARTSQQSSHVMTTWRDVEERSAVRAGTPGQRARLRTPVFRLFACPRPILTQPLSALPLRRRVAPLSCATMLFLSLRHRGAAIGRCKNTSPPAPFSVITRAASHSARGSPAKPAPYFLTPVTR